MASVITPDIAGLRALSHPVRLRILGLLRTEGPATATGLARRLDLNTGATSYHLRQLAQHGFIEEDAERGNARDRWWRAAHQSTRTDFREEGVVDADVEAYLTNIVMLYADRMRAAVSEMAFLPEEWRPVGALSDWERRLTPAQAEALVQRVVAVIDEAEDSDSDEAVPFTVNLNAFPRPGQRWGEREGEPRDER